MQKLLSFLFFIFTFTIIFAQKTVSGKVTDSNGGPVPSASITVEEPGKDAIIAYGISNAKGEYKVTFTSSESTVDLKIKAFNQKTQTRNVKNETQTQNFNLDSETTEIKEIKLKTKLITKKGDTISYDLKSFESKADRTLADVLKKIPGIEVNKDGSVLYQGEPINKFYVNGKDLMEGGYGTINNSLPKDAVSKVEVMENHQPVKILQDKVPSENAAINVKLKNKVTMTGRGEIGAGLDPLLWNVKLTPMFFGQKNQWVINYKANNNGESVEKEGSLLSFGNRWEGKRSQMSANRWLGVDQARVPNIPEKRYLMNNVHYFSANLLTNPFKNKEWELKLNSSYSNNSISRDAYSETVYEPSTIFPNGAVALTRSSNNFYTDNAKGEMIITKNAKKGFFKNTTTWNGFWNLDQAQSSVDNAANGFTTTFNESMNAPSGVFQNSMSTIIPYKEKLVNFMSYVKYQKDRQKLVSLNKNFFDLDEIMGGHYDRYDQSIALKTLEVDHSASVGFSYKKWVITPEVGLNLSFNDMNSQFYGNGRNLGSRFRNDMIWNEINPYSQVMFNFKGQALNLNLTIPVNFYGIDYKDNINATNREISKTVVEPSLWGSYDFASFWKLWGFANLNYNYGDFGSLYDGYILTSPRNLGNNNSILPENRFINASSRIEYRNPLNNLFFNVRYTFSNNKRNLLARTQQFASGASNTEIIAYDNSTTTNAESAEIGKYFPKFKTNASVNFSNRDSNGFSLLVDKADVEHLVETKNNTQSFGFKFNNTYFSWMSVDYNLSMNWNKNTNLFSNTTNKTSGWNHNLATYFYPLESHTIGFFWDDVTTAQGENSYRNSFFDVSYQYTWTKKKIDFELKWLNIANKKVYQTVSYNTALLATTTSSIDIRPSQFMFTVKFNFK